jgi:hypothetical protein
MPQEYVVSWHEDVPMDQEFQCITDHTGWKVCTVYSETYYPNCYQGIVSSELGYIRGRGVFGDTGEPSETGWSNVKALPEPSINIAILISILFMRLLCQKKIKVF